MTEARRKELERRQWQKEESMPVVKEKRKFSLFTHHHHRSESHGAAAIIQLPAVEQKQQTQGVSAVPPPLSEGSPPSKAIGFLHDRVVLLRKGLSVAWVPWPPPTAYSAILDVARSQQRPPCGRQQGSTETSPPTTRMLKAVPPNPRVFTNCSGPPQTKDQNGKRGQTTIYARLRQRGERTFLMEFLLSVWGWVGTGGCRGCRPAGGGGDGWFLVLD